MSAPVLHRTRTRASRRLSHLIWRRSRPPQARLYQNEWAHISAALVKGCKGGDAPSLVKSLCAPEVGLDNVQGSDTSPLITAMMKRLPENPRRDWVTAMLDVSEEVLTLTRNKQRPNIDVDLR